MIQTLNGRWKLDLPDGKKTIGATVPGWTHTDLHAAGVIADPYFRDNANGLQWISERDWRYHRQFRVAPRVLGKDRVLLRCHGLDTFAKLTLNGRVLGQTDNMYRTWEYDVGELLRSGDNELDVVFSSVLPFIRKRAKEQPLYQWGRGHKASYAYIRKAPYQFGWDWAPRLIGYGIWKDIELVAFDTARILDVAIAQKHRGGRVRLAIDGQFERTRAGLLTAECSLELDGRPIAVASAKTSKDRFTLSLEVRKPELWWPNGLGAQPLYRLVTRLVDADGAVVDEDIKRIGLRTIELVQKKDRWGSCFYFKVNGRAVWGRGANWVPADSVPASITADRYRRLVSEMASQNMNLLRVWGGGLYESDAFYDACDEAGVLVWQDFMFACSVYPCSDQKLLENTRLEARDNIRRIRHHACHCLWCGNNELEEGLVGPNSKKQMPVAEYNALFNGLLPRQVRELDPGKPYIRTSGQTPGTKRDALTSRDPFHGDSHLWFVMNAVWQTVKGVDPARLSRLRGDELHDAKWQIGWGVYNGLDKFQRREVVPRFASELGYHSLPVMETIRSFTEASDRDALSPVMEFHQQGGNGRIVSDVVSRFGTPERLEDLVPLSQIVQGESFRWLVESWRRAERPRGMGALHWTCNDCWPAVEWSTIDYYLRRKASFYIFKRFYSPLLVTAEEDRSGGFFDPYFVNDSGRRVTGTLTWTVTDLAGQTLLRGNRKVSADPCQSVKAGRVQIERLVVQHGKQLLVWLDLSVAGQSVSSNLVLLLEPRQLSLFRPRFDVRVVSKDANLFQVTVRTDRPSLWTELTGGGQGADWSDNWFHLRPGVAKVVTCRTERPMTLARFRKALSVTSFLDHCPLALASSVKLPSRATAGLVPPHPDDPVYRPLG